MSIRSLRGIESSDEDATLTWEVPLNRGEPMIGVGAVPGHDQWRMRCVVEPSDGLLVLTSVEVSPAGAPGRSGLTTACLKSVRVGQILRHAHAAAQQAQRDLDGWDWGASRPVQVPAAEVQRRTGRAGRGDLYYAELARDYLARIAAGSKRPREDIAEARGGVKGDLIRDQLHIARSRGLLEGGAQGRAGGRLSDRAQHLLTEAEAER